MSKFNNKVTVSEITNLSKQQADQNALRMKNPIIVPVYVAIDIDKEDGLVGTITSPSLNAIFNKEIVLPGRAYTEKEYIIFKSFQNGITSGTAVEEVLGKYQSFQEWFSSEGISEEALYEMKERFEKENELPQQDIKGYMGDIGKY